MARFESTMFMVEPTEITCGPQEIIHPMEEETSQVIQLTIIVIENRQ